MREPYRTLFSGYEGHWLLSHYLLGDEPDWDGLAAEEKLACLSSGEKVLLGIAGAFAGDTTCPFARVADLDAAHRRRVAYALLAVSEEAF